MSMSEIKKMWQIFLCRPNCILEMRALLPKGAGTLHPKSLVKHFRAMEFQGNRDALRSAFEQEALRLNSIGYNVYIVMNPIKPDFPCKAAARDEDIEYRDLLLIDIDRASKTQCPASDAELGAAKQVADDVCEYLSTRGWGDPVQVMSGNGYHLYYNLREVLNTPEAKSFCESVLKGLASQFNTPETKIDISVFNASRITKVPGTVMRKGDESAERPYRMAVVL
jgi:hypothetical protein